MSELATPTPVEQAVGRMAALEARVEELEGTASEAINDLGDDLDLAGEVMLRVVEVIARLRAAVLALANDPMNPAAAAAAAINILEVPLGQNAEGGDVVRESTGDQPADA